MRPWQNRMKVHVRKVGEPVETRLTGARERDIAGYARANEHQILHYGTIPAFSSPARTASAPSRSTYGRTF